MSFSNGNNCACSTAHMTGEGWMMHRCSLYLLLVMPKWTSNFPKISADLELNTWHFERRGFFCHRQVGVGDVVNWQKQTVPGSFKPCSWPKQFRSQLWKWCPVVSPVSRAAFTHHNPKSHQGCLSFSNGSVLQMWQ